MTPINIDPKYHSMPEKPHSHSCPQCGHIIADTTSGKCHNCGHLFDHRQFGGQREEVIGSRYKRPRRVYTEKPITDDSKPPSAAPNIKAEPICPRCKTTINSTNVMDEKCPFCGYIGPMTSRQIDEPWQTPAAPQEEAYSPTMEPLGSEPKDIFQEAPVREVSSVSDSSALIDAAPKDWKKAKPASKLFKKFPRAKTIDKSEEWKVESTNGLSFASLLQKIRRASNNFNIGFPFKRVLTIFGTLVLAALIVVGIVKIIPLISPSSLSSTISQQTTPTNGNKTAETLILDVVNDDITYSSATITWTTNKPATSKIEYGTDKTYAQGVSSDDNPTLDHRITLDSLKSDTNYFYKITCIDSDGNEIIYEAEQSFTTKMPPDTTAPVISKVTVIPSKISDRSAIISWELDDKEASSYIEYGIDERYDNKKIPDKDSANIRTAMLGGLKPSTKYSFRIISEDSYGNKAEPYTGVTFTTLAPVPTGVKKGDRAPDFNLEYFTGDNLPQEYVFNGNTVNLSDFRGKVVVVNFWSISCGACIAEMPDIQRLYDNSDNSELIILAIHTIQYRSRIERFLENKDWTLPILLDANGQTSREYKITTIPRTFFIDTEGIIRKVKFGRFNGLDEIQSILEYDSLLGSQ